MLINMILQQSHVQSKYDIRLVVVYRSITAVLKVLLKNGSFSFCCLAGFKQQQLCQAENRINIISEKKP